MKRLFTSLLMMFAISTIGFGQNGQYDVRLNLNSYDCNSQELLIDIDVRASSSNTTFRIAEQNYRFSFNIDAIDSVSIVEEGVISGFSSQSGGDLGFSLYNPHNLEGTLDNEISYNVELAGGDGVLIETEWGNVGTLSLSISDIDAPLDLNWYAQSNFPPTFISEKYEGTPFAVAEGIYINDVGANTFGEICTCPLNDIVLTTQQEVDDFTTNYPDCTELVGSLIIDSNAPMYIYGISPLSVITSIGGNLTIANNAFNNYSLVALENITSIGGNLTIINNNSLNDLVGLENMTIGGDITITNNDQLSSCNIQNVCDYIENGGTVVIDNNASGCNSIAEVDKTCLPDCPSGDITLIDDWDVNNFLSDYPNCTELTGSLTVQSNSFDEYSGFWDLSFLSQITSVAGNLNIYNNNYYVFSLGGLDNLTFVGGDLNIGGNANLYGLGGLGNLSTVNGRLNIDGNQSLTSLNGLTNLTTIGDLKITSNYGLSICNVPFICEYLANNGSYEISGNGVGCGTEEEVSALCSPTPPLCPSGGIGVTSQSELSNFASLYPNCTEIAGDLHIQINDIFEFANLHPLEQITSIQGNLTISGVGVYKLTGLTNLSSVGGYLEVHHTLVEDLNSLDNLTSINGNLIITNNSSLNVCNTVSICNHLENGGMATISDNGSGCSSNLEVIQSCFLPVEISTPLQARLQNQTAVLTWRTETETNNSGFEIQRSQDGVQWQRIGWQAGQGTTTTPHAYTYTDENPLSGTSYYRLKQVDFDGNFSYSNIADLYYERNTPINIYPNPVQDILHINTEYTIQEVRIFDTTGRTTKVQMTNNTIDVSTLTAGIYTLKITVERGIFYEKILVK